MALYDKHYAPDEWKLQLFKFNFFDLAPWISRVSQSKTDLEFYDICVDYVASLKDSHNSFSIPSNFYAYLPIAADIYDGKVLIGLIDRTSLPVNAFPFRIGDELVSVDGRHAVALVEAWQRHFINGLGNPITKRRFAVGTITDRFQQLFPCGSGYNLWLSRLRRPRSAIRPTFRLCASTWWLQCRFFLLGHRRSQQP